MIEYRIRPKRPTTHLFEVHCTVPDPDPAGQVLALPSWIPGSYLVRDFARNIVSIHANVELEKIDKQTWRCEPTAGPLVVNYEVYAFDESVRTAFLNETRGFFNGTSVFLRVAGREAAACEVLIEAPDDAQYEEWQVATTLPHLEIDERGFGRYQADGYDQLIDYPVEMGAFDLLEYEAGGVPHAMALCGAMEVADQLDAGRLTMDLKKICEAQQAMFGGSPVQRYLFLTLVKNRGYGGLEHRDSSSLICSRGDLPAKGMQEVSAEYQRFLGLCSHEYFHLWNVKRIRPPAVAASDLAAEAHFRDLWAYEGITSYYDELMLLRAGVIDPQAYLDELARTITRVWRTPGRRGQSLAESSFDAWTKFYKQDENAANAIVSYYAKGAVVALCLDLQMRLDSDGRYSLDDVMRLLWQRYGSRDEPVPEHGVEAAVQEVMGASYEEFFQAYVHNTEDPPVVELLEAFGIEVTLRQRHSLEDAGGRSTQKLVSDADMGIVTAQEQSREVVKVVINDRPGERAGLQPGDELLALDGQRLVPGSLSARLNAYTAGDCCELHVLRDEQLLEKTVTLGEKPRDTWEFRVAPEASETALERRRAWWQ